MKRKRFIQIIVVCAMAFVAGQRCGAQAISIITCDSTEDVNVGSVQTDKVTSQTQGSMSPNFAAGLFGNSSEDGSTANVSMVTTYSGGKTFTFTGQGHVVFGGGVYDGTGSQLAGGQITSYADVVVNVPMQFQCGLSFHSTAMLPSQVGFHGVILGLTSGQYPSEDETTTLSGSLPAGANFSLIGACNNNNGAVGGEARWSYTLSLTPLSLPPRFNAKQKATFFNSYLGTLAEANQLLAQSTGNEADITPSLSAAILQFANAEFLRSEFLDPLDTNYTELAQVTIPPVAPLAVGGDITQLEASAYNAWLTNLSQSAGYGAALNTSLNRAQGAAYVSNSYWSVAQMSAAVQFEAKLAAVMDKEPDLRSNVVVQFAAGGFSEMALATNDAINLQMDILTNGLPTNVVAGLLSLGVDNDSITNIQAAFTTADSVALTTTFPQNLNDTNLDVAQLELASGLRDASLTLINPALLPGGQFRFDLPTEPGYTYTIQFTQTPANPASWTPIYTNIATTALLSFTNAVPVSAQAGFYQATHN